MKEEQTITGRRMCEIITRSGLLKREDGTAPTWKEIWEYYPNGELYMIFHWYKKALYRMNRGSVIQYLKFLYRIVRYGKIRGSRLMIPGPLKEIEIQNLKFMRRYNPLYTPTE